MRTILNLLALIVATLAIASCTAMPARQAVDAANVIYTQGSDHHMTAAKVPLDAARVWESFNRVLSEHPNLRVINRNGAAMMLEVTRGDLRLTGQVTSLGTGRSLLYIWADAGDSGISGRELSERAVQVVCDDLGVSIEHVKY